MSVQAVDGCVIIAKCQLVSIGCHFEIIACVVVDSVVHNVVHDIDNVVRDVVETSAGEQHFAA